MANLFESTNYRTAEPTLEEYGYPIVAGDYTAWKREDLGSDYPTADYSLVYNARLNNSGSTEIEISASESGDDYLIEVASSTSANYSVGIYQWDAFITKTSDSNRIRIKSGTWEVVANLAASTADPRSHVKIVLDAVEAVIENRASQDQMAYSIAGRSLSRMSVDDLMLFRNRYKAEWLREKRNQRMKHGLGNDSIILSRLPT